MTKKVTRAPKEKIKAILEAAAQTVAEQGSTASTALIAKRAKVAEGTIFKYFPTKDDLLNNLYLFIKADLRSHIPPKKEEQPFDEWLHLSWNRLIKWGMKRIHYVHTMQLLRVSQRIKAETLDEGLTLFPEFKEFFQKRTSSSSSEVQRWQIRLLDNSLASSACSILNFANDVKDPEQREACISAGFALFWNGIKNF